MGSCRRLRRRSKGLGSGKKKGGGSWGFGQVVWISGGAATGKGYLSLVSRRRKGVSLGTLDISSHFLS